MLQPDELDAIAARASAATLGPWETWPDGTEESVESTSLGRFVCHLNSNMRQFREDAAFIAASRSDVPKLLAEVRRLHEVERIAVEALNLIARCGCSACGEAPRDLAHARTLADDALTRMDAVE